MEIDKYQIKASRAKEKNVLVVAAPGSGKTTVIINRINYLISEMKIREGNIIVLTFTKAAAVNMKNRYLKSFNKNAAPFFGTFHGLFYKILLRQGYKINIIQGYVVNKIIEGVLRKYFDEVNEDKIKEVVNNISLFNTSGLNINDFQPTISREIFIKAYETYSKYKKENNMWDFDDLAIKAIELLKNNKKVRDGYTNLFKYILVDEFQDCDELQIKFLRIINKGKENSLFAVGDEDQCIYSFRGSKPEYMVSFNEIFNNSKKYYLSINYRSTKNIVEASKKLISNNKSRNNKEIIANRTLDGILNHSIVTDERTQGEEISKVIKENTKNKKYKYRDNIVLYRTNMESMSIVDSFIRNDIPFTMLDREYNFFNHFICRDLLDYLRYAINPYDRSALLNIINKPFRYISKSAISYVKGYREETIAIDILINKNDIAPFQKKKLEELKSDFNYLNKISLPSAIQFIIMDLGYIDYLKAYCEKFGSSIEDLEEILESFKESAASFKTIISFFEHIDEVNKKLEESKRNLKDDRVLLSTVHGVKGMECTNVFVINCIEDSFPHYSGKKDNLEEESRLFYVGVTRAKDNLYLYTPRSRRGSFKDISRFIEEGGFIKMSKPLHGLNKGFEIHHRNYGNGIIENVNGDEITILFHNGERRKFSGKVLIDNNLLIVIS